MIDILFAGVYFIQKAFWKLSYSPKTQGNLWATNARFINHWKKEENTAKAAKNSKENWGISWKRPAKPQKLWNLNLQQLSKDWAKQKDVPELLISVSREENPASGSLQVTTLGEGWEEDDSQAHRACLNTNTEPMVLHTGTDCSELQG